MVLNLSSIGGCAFLDWMSDVVFSKRTVQIRYPLLYYMTRVSEKCEKQCSWEALQATRTRVYIRPLQLHALGALLIPACSYYTALYKNCSQVQVIIVRHSVWRWPHGEAVGISWPLSSLRSGPIPYSYQLRGVGQCILAPTFTWNTFRCSVRVYLMEYRYETPYVLW